MKKSLLFLFYHWFQNLSVDLCEFREGRYRVEVCKIQALDLIFQGFSYFKVFHSHILVTIQGVSWSHNTASLCDIMSFVMTLTAKVATMMMMVMVMLKVLVTMTDKWLWCWWWLNSWRRGGRCRRRLTSSQLWRSPTSLSPSYYHLTTIFVINIAGIFIIIIYPIIISGLQKNSDKQTHSCYMIIANGQASTSWIHLFSL